MSEGDAVTPVQPTDVPPWFRGDTKRRCGAESGSGRRRLAGGAGLVGGRVQLLLAAALLVAVVFDALGELLQRLVFPVGTELAVGADAEGDGVGLLLDGVGGLLEEVLRLNSQWRAGRSSGTHDQSGLGEAAVDQFRTVLDLLEFALHDAGQVVEVGGGEVGQTALDQ
nr:hypothetical protein [Streptomyces sp. NBC_01451]